MNKIYYFFFQAEDGIRDIGVTGVQTCALPIYAPVPDPLCGRRPRPCRDDPLRPRQGPARLSREDRRRRPQRRRAARSEERRVGKECRSRWSPSHLKKKKKTTTVTFRLRVSYFS